MKIDPTSQLENLSLQTQNLTSTDLSRFLAESIGQDNPAEYLANQLLPFSPNGTSFDSVHAFSQQMLVASHVVFDRSEGTISIYPGTVENPGEPQVFPAGNNTTSDSNGPWPNGTYPFSWHADHPESGPNDSYGSNGNFIFEVPEHTGMGIHSGRENQGGPTHPTNGCIRTTDAGTQALEEINQTNPIQSITVQD